MAVTIIVSYDGTTHDDDALMLARMLSAAGATVSLAYVRHSREYDPRREEIGVHDAERRLAQGVAWLGDETIATHIVVNPSTSAGLAELAAEQGADLVVFGSDYRTPPGRVEPQASAQSMLDGGRVAVGVATAGLRTRQDPTIASLAIAGEDGGPAAASAAALASASGAELVPGSADLLIVDSAPTSPPGRIALSGATRNQLDSARGSVIVLPGATPLAF